MMTVPQRIKALSVHMKGGGTVQQFIQSNEITVGQAKHAMKQAKRLGMIPEGDNHWFRRAQAEESAKARGKIAEMFADGMSATQIAESLGVSQQRVSVIWKRICSEMEYD